MELIIKNGKSMLCLIPYLKVCELEIFFRDSGSLFHVEGQMYDGEFSLAVVIPNSAFSYCKKYFLGYYFCQEWF